MEFGSAWGTKWEICCQYQDGVEKQMEQRRASGTSSSQRVRRCCAKLLGRLLLFGAPLLLFTVMFIILVITYALRPFSITKNFAHTTCQVLRHDIRNMTSSCSAGSGAFPFCLQVWVAYPTGQKNTLQNGIILENEQALANCQCSYTFGYHGLLHHYQEPCGSWKEGFDMLPCVEDFMATYPVGITDDCYFNPDSPEEIVWDLTVNMNDLIHLFSWPVLLCFSYVLAWAFVCYDSKQRCLLEESIVEELYYQHEERSVTQMRIEDWKKYKLSHALCAKKGLCGKYHTVGASGRIVRPNPTHQLKSKQSEVDVSTNIIHLSALDLSNSAESVQDLPFTDVEYPDLRHLDLAVSQENINNLVLHYRVVDSYTTQSVMNGYDLTNARSAKGQVTPLKQLTLPIQSKECCFIANGDSNNLQSFVDNRRVSAAEPKSSPYKNSPLLKECSIQPSAGPERTGSQNPGYSQEDFDRVFAEEGIDSFYPAANEPRGWSEVGEGRRIVSMFSANEESEV